MSPSKTFDYVIVGSGSAGAVIANRLSASGKFSVLLLEAGQRDKNLWIHVPAGFARLFTDRRTSWGHLSGPEPELNGRTLFHPYGRVLGGSSSVNGMIYVRGQREDYDHWLDLGNDGWGYADVLPYFKRAERHQYGESEFHGGTGPIHVHDQFRRHELVDAYISAASEVGIPRNEDFNGEQSEGAGYYQLTTDGWRRSSTAVGYLRPAAERSNLTIAVDAYATKILLDGKRAAGVEYISSGQALRAIAQREVIISAGSIGSPHLLQLSGIGPAERLRSAGIAVHYDLPAVGENLEDHFIATSVYECTLPLTVNDAVRTVWGRVRLAWDYWVRQTGYLTIGASYGGGFFRTNGAANRADVQCFFSLFSSEDFKSPDSFPGISVGIFQSRPSSKGWVRTFGPDPLQRPDVRMNYLSTQEDRDTLTAGLELVHRLMQAPSLAPYIRRRAKPAPAVTGAIDLLHWARDNGVGALHGTGTCRMGASTDSVVDPRLRVRGISGLRIADGSVMPALVSGNTNAPIIMIGEKASDMILEDAR